MTVSKVSASGTKNEVMLEAIHAIATSTVNKMSSDRSDIFHNPTNISELEENTSTISNIVALKLKNSLVQN